jgi:hypothetical protein
MHNAFDYDETRTLTGTCAKCAIIMLRAALATVAGSAFCPQEFDSLNGAEIEN